jgi:hypothetical protein
MEERIVDKGWQLAATSKLCLAFPLALVLMLVVTSPAHARIACIGTTGHA